MLGKWVRCAHEGDASRIGRISAVGRLGSVPRDPDSWDFPELRYQVEFTAGHTGRRTLRETEDAFDNYSTYTGVNQSSGKKLEQQYREQAKVCIFCGGPLDATSMEMFGDFCTKCMYRAALEQSEEDWGALSDD